MLWAAARLVPIYGPEADRKSGNTNGPWGEQPSDGLYQIQPGRGRETWLTRR